jgi:hypothetical protein
VKKVGRRFEDETSGMIVEVRAAVPTEATERDVARVFANIAAVMTVQCDARRQASVAMNQMMKGKT